MKFLTKERVLFALGLLICFSVAAASVLLEQVIPGELLGASIIALFVGTIINSFFHPKWIQPALKFTSKKILKGAIILLGASLSVSTILSVGKMTFFVMIFTLCYVLWRWLFYPQTVWPELEAEQPHFRRHRHLRRLCSGSHCAGDRCG